MQNLYQDILMDHYRHPRNRGELAGADFASESFNPSCGDRVSFAGTVQANIVSHAKFQGSGCVISQATASLLTQAVEGKTVDEVCSLERDFVLSLIGMELGPTRLKCALLPLEALQEGLTTYARK